MAALMSGAMPAVAADNTSPTASATIYDFTGFTDKVVLDLFYDALQNGRNYPTMEEFAKAGIQASDIAFIRSHVKKRALLSDEDRVVQTTYSKRNLWMNIPMGSGKSTGGYPSSAFASDVYSMWNYTNLFGSWNHSFFRAPGAWVDAAHKNGTDIMSGVRFFDTTGGRTGGAEDYTTMIKEKNADGSYKYVKPLINCLLYFGSDGINYNFEAAGYADKDVIAFHQALYKEAKARHFDNFHIGIYTSNASLTSSNIESLFGSKTNGKTADVMLNYMSSDFTSSAPESVRLAEQTLGTADGVYMSTWIVSMNRSWQLLDNKADLDYNTWQYVYTPDADAHKCGVCLWGEHDQSRFWSYNSGSDAYKQQDNYQSLLEKGFSGGKRNPLTRPAVSSSGNDWEGTNPLGNFAGLATWIPERSAIQGNLPFATYFNLGNGDRYYYKGKKAAGSWYNLADQDVVPTYRWLVVNDASSLTASTAIQPSFTHDDAYTGGSSLLLTGKSTASSTDIVLYKTDLINTAGNAVAKVAIKSGKEGTTASNLYLLLQVNGAWKEFAVGNTTGKTWEEKNIPLNLGTSDKITRIGLRVKNSDANYSLMVGKIELNNDLKTAVSAVKDVKMDIKEETKGSLTVKAYWSVEGTADEYGRLDNSQGNIDHFEVLYKNGQDGRVSEVARTTQWGTLVSNIMLGEDDKPFIGVRAASTDLKTYSPVVWTEVQRADPSTLPDLVTEDSYGVSRIDPSSAGIQNAYDLRWVQSVTSTGATKNLNYSATSSPADHSQYADARDQVLEVAQGQTVKMHIQPYNTTNLSSHDGLRYCFGGGWIDWNGSGNFDHPDPVTRSESEIANGKTSTDPEGERVFFCGTLRKGTPSMETDGIDVQFTVPNDAHVGDSRLRIVFSDAWFAGAFLPTGLTNKGFTLDFGVKITGNTEGQRMPTETRDQGVAEQPEGLNSSTNINTIENGKMPVVVAKDGKLSLKNISKAWVYTTDGKLVKYVKTAADLVLPAGVYVVKTEANNVVRTTKVVL